MATKPTKAIKSAAKKRGYTNAQLAAAKKRGFNSADVAAAKKRGFSNADVKAAKARKATTTKPAATPATAAGVLPAARPAPVATADGTLVDPAQWERDQARLMAAEADNDAMAAIEGEEIDARLTEQAEGIEYKQSRDLKALAAQRQRSEYAKVKPVQKAKVGTNLSYRGMGRGSAAKRQFKNVASEQAANDAMINETESRASTEYTANIGAAAQRRAARLASLAPKKLTLAARGARSGVYTR